MSKFTKVIFDCMLLLVLLGMLFIPIGSFGLINVKPQSSVLSTKDSRENIQEAPTNIRRPKLINTGAKHKEATESTESEELDSTGY